MTSFVMKSRFQLLARLGVCLLTALILLTVAPVGTCGQEAASKETEPEPDTESKILEVSGTATFQFDPEQKLLVAPLDLGALPVGQQVMVRMKLENQSDQPLKFSGVSKRCSCSQFKPERKSIEPGEQINAKLLIRIPNRNQLNAIQSEVVLVHQEKPVAKIELAHTISGLLAFKNRFDRVIFKLGDEQVSVSVPILATAPVDITKVQVGISENLKGLTWEIKPAESGGMLAIVAPESIAQDGSFRGDITITDPVSERTDQIYLLVRDDRSATISPKFILMKRGDDGSYVGSAIIRLPAAEPGEDESEFEIKCSYDGQEAIVETSPLSKEIHKATIIVGSEAAERLSRDFGDEEAPPQLQWEFKFNGRESSSETPVVLKNDSGN